MNSSLLKTSLSCALIFSLLQGCGGGGGGNNQSSTTSPRSSAPSNQTSDTTNSISAVVRSLGYFKASNTGAGDTFGWSIALSSDGRTLAVGAPLEDGDNDGSTDSGAVYIFVNSGSGWIQQAYIKAGNIQPNANFGESVALSSDGSELIVGAPFEDNMAGSVYVFARSGTTWSSQARIKANNAANNAYFGWSLALSSDGVTVAVGSPGESNSTATINSTDHTASNAGAVYVFSRTTDGNWGNQVYLKAAAIAAEDNFGVALALNGTGTTLAAGAPSKSNGTGIAYVFTYANGVWGTPVPVTASNADQGDNFGAALALNGAGNVLAIGAPYEASNATGINGAQSDNSDANSGAAYVFTANGNGWSQQAYVYVKASNTDANDDFGTSLALSSDGTLLAVGAIGESSSATASDGNQNDNTKDGVGAVYLFKHSDTGWAQQTYMKPSASTSGDEFGTAIGMSANGGTIVISGAYEQSNAKGIGGNQNDISAVDAGAVWLF